MGSDSNFEGVRPKNAVCLNCDYHFGGLEIKDGVIRCPECGHAQTFELPNVEPPPPRFNAKPAMQLTLLCLGVGIVLTAVSLAVQTAAAVTLVLIFLVVPISLCRAMVNWRRAKRRWLEHQGLNRGATSDPSSSSFARATSSRPDRTC